MTMRASPGIMWLPSWREGVTEVGFRADSSARCAGHTDRLSHWYGHIIYGRWYGLGMARAVVESGVFVRQPGTCRYGFGGKTGGQGAAALYSMQAACDSMNVCGSVSPCRIHVYTIQ